VRVGEFFLLCAVRKEEFLKKMKLTAASPASKKKFRYVDFKVLELDLFSLIAESYLSRRACMPSR
jgi:hypothetical protein